MGYTHYWYRTPKIVELSMNKIVADFGTILPEFKSLLGDWHGEPKDIDLTGNIIGFNGLGEASHETFHFPLIQDVPDYQAKDPNLKGKVFVFCKTACKPYDIAVTSALIIIKHHLGDSIKVSSDGEREDWGDAIALCQAKLSYGRSFFFNEDGDLCEVQK